MATTATAIKTTPTTAIASSSRRPRKKVYQTSPTKRARRSKGDVARVRGEILAVLAVSNPQSVRQLFYQLVTRGAIDKTEADYKQTVCRLTAEMRRSGELPYDWLADSTRWMRKPTTYASLNSMLEHQQDFYRRDLWAEQDAYVEVWLEKDALSGVLYDVTSEWDVPLMVTRGYPSLSFLHSAAAQIREEKRPVYLYYFGDHDPSGVDITRAVEEGIRGFAPDADLHFNRVAVQDWQIEAYGLQTRPTKKTDSRSRNFDGESVEVDAIPAETLKAICRNRIVSHIDHDRLDRLREVEKAERTTLSYIQDALKGLA
jgi:hypothetical protein